ncbi:hypothetical protein [Vibrio agarivorans]|uniref:Nucleoside transporter/FeoB GTPase Gate domain-containing protein n=1 Tax=Vibrio agarivorans TaxID=153622 RepID=A0ABT7Y7C1_9VIBR|nr:hypothetical protein [Vibrio agarivorans]MDN2483924.1 hypothetical protein [Vibrio agarivorans]
MFWIIRFLRPQLTPFFTLIGIAAIYAYATGQDINATLGKLLSPLVPIALFFKEMALDIAQSLMTSVL